MLSETSFESATSFESTVVRAVEKSRFEARRLPRLGLKAETSATVNAVSLCAAGDQCNIT